MPTPSGTRLRARAYSLGKYIGYASADDFWTYSDTASYQATAGAEFNILTPENELKWEVTEATQNVFDFSTGDQHVQFARNNGMIVHGHNLAWGQSNPSWLTGGSWTPTTLTNVLYNHIDHVVGHYVGQIQIWDVVNEPINTASIWNNVIGSTYVDLALRRAHAADPDAILLINEYGAETVNSTSNSLYTMCQSLVNAGSPLGGVGFEMHIDESGIDYSSFATNIARFAALGLGIYITEMDVRIPSSPSAGDLATQATIYQNVLTTCLQQPAFRSFQMWGFTDNYSWIPSNFPGLGAALPFDTTYTAKPAYFALQGALVAAPTPPNPFLARIL